MLKVFDKNIDCHQPAKMEIIEPPVFDEFASISNKLEIYRNALPSLRVEEDDSSEYIEGPLAQHKNK